MIVYLGEIACAVVGAGAHPSVTDALARYRRDTISVECGDVDSVSSLAAPSVLAGKLFEKQLPVVRCRQLPVVRADGLITPLPMFFPLRGATNGNSLVTVSPLYGIFYCNSFVMY